METQEVIPVLKFENIAKEIPFKIQIINWPKEDEKNFYEPVHSQNYFEVIWIEKGNGIFRSDFHDHSFTDNRVFCVKPGQTHQLIPANGLYGFTISFTESFLNISEDEFDSICPIGICQLFSESKGIFVADEEAKDMRVLIDKLIKEFDNQYPFRLQIIKRFFKVFLIYLTRQFEENLQTTKHSRNMDIVQTFLTSLDKNYKEKKMVSDYSSELFVTPNYLNEIIKKSTGYSASHHIRQRIALEAKRMGRYSGSCMKEIAYSLGFSDSAHFSKFFKGVTGKNFSDFKKEGLNLSLSIQH
jgi:AraC family transcriptional activator of pobA